MSTTANTLWPDAYDDDPAIIYALDHDLRFVRCNPAWDRFAKENGAPDLTRSNVYGRCIMDVVPDVLRNFYTIAYDSVRRFRRQWWHIFECPSPTQARSFQMRILPREGDGLLIVNTLIREEPHEEQIPARIEEYTDADGIATVCSHCRRAEHLSEPNRWDFVPLLLITNAVLRWPGLCPFCSNYHSRREITDSNAAR
jgi:hypothetical protein